MFSRRLSQFYKENMSEEIEELRDQIGGKLDIFILTWPAPHRTNNFLFHKHPTLFRVSKMIQTHLADINNLNTFSPGEAAELRVARAENIPASASVKSGEYLPNCKLNCKVK